MNAKVKFKYSNTDNLKIVYAAGSDVANKQMKDNGRSQWNKNDYNIAVETFNNLSKIINNKLDND